jgi:cell volume regulation protein A
LAAAYGFKLAEGEAILQLGGLVAKRLGRRAVVGDRIRIGTFVLTVRLMDAAGVITQIGLKCPPRADGA